MKRCTVLSGIDRKGMYSMLADKGYTVGAEVGVFQGQNAQVLLDTIPNLKLYLVDPYLAYSYIRRRSRNKWKWHQPTMDTIRRKALKRLADRDVVWLMQPSKIASRYIDDGALDFVYIDGDHRFDYVMQDILEWAPKVRDGGCITGHDYGIRAVRAAVDVYAKRNDLKILVTDRKIDRGVAKCETSWWILKESK
jgi:hypothetical protein